MTPFDEIRDAAEKQGYHMIHGEETWGERTTGLIVLTKLGRPLDRERDGKHVYAAVEALKRGFATVAAEIDPDGPGKVEAELRGYRGIYSDAGVEAIYVEAVPNGYCKDPCCLNRPWARITSRIGHVLIGCRKRVISIDWKDTVLAGKTGLELFPGEDTTRGATFIHAWGAAKASEYILRLHLAVEPKLDKESP